MAHILNSRTIDDCHNDATWPVSGVSVKIQIWRCTRFLCIIHFLLVASSRLRQISQKRVVACAGFGSRLVTTPLPRVADNNCGLAGGEEDILKLEMSHTA